MVARLELKEYVRADGSNPYQQWFDTLDLHAAAKIAVAKVRLANGNVSNLKWFSGIGEYVINWGPGYRIYLARDGESLMILLGGGTKKRQQADIDLARFYLSEYKERKRCGEWHQFNDS